jgi:hypothetical protein
MGSTSRPNFRHESLVVAQWSFSECSAVWSAREREDLRCYPLEAQCLVGAYPKAPAYG